MNPILSFNKNLLFDAIFLERPNRFLGIVNIGNQIENIHIHDPGRVPLLRRGVKVRLLHRIDGKRKTKYDLISFLYNGEWVFSHSGYHSRIFEETVNRRLIKIEGKLKREVRIGSSRIDFVVDNSPVEIKGCTWIKEKYCYFPDAPTSRGRRHVAELIRYVSSRNTRAYLVFLAFSKNVQAIKIAEDIDPKFMAILQKANKVRNVEIFGIKYMFDGKNVFYLEEIPVEL